MSSSSSTDEGAVLLAVLPKVTGWLSILGSSFNLCDILTDNKKRQSTYPRLVAAMAALDIVLSFAYFLSTWPIPADSGVLWAAGNTATCTAQGFVVQLGLAVPLYNLCLTTYSAMVINLKWNSYKIQRYERYMHATALSVPLAVALAGIPLSLYNNANLWCWIAAHPPTCLDGNTKAPPDDNYNGNYNDDDHIMVVECTRGKYAWIYRWTFFYGPLWLVIVLVTCCMGWIASGAQKDEKSTRAFRLRSSLVQRGSISMAGMDNLSRLTRNVLWQCFYYVLAFYVTWTFPTVLRGLQTAGRPVPYSIQALMAALLPMQGFFNALVFVRPRYLRYRRKNPREWWCRIAFKAVAKTLGKLRPPANNGGTGRNNSLNWGISMATTVRDQQQNNESDTNNNEEGSQQQRETQPDTATDHPAKNSAAAAAATPAANGSNGGARVPYEAAAAAAAATKKPPESKLSWWARRIKKGSDDISRRTDEVEEDGNDDDNSSDEEDDQQIVTIRKALDSDDENGGGGIVGSGVRRTGKRRGHHHQSHQADHSDDEEEDPDMTDLRQSVAIAMAAAIGGCCTTDDVATARKSALTTTTSDPLSASFLRDSGTGGGGGGGGGSLLFEPDEIREYSQEYSQRSSSLASSAYAAGQGCETTTETPPARRDGVSSSITKHLNSFAQKQRQRQQQEEDNNNEQEEEQGEGEGSLELQQKRQQEEANHNDSLNNAAVAASGHDEGNNSRCNNEHSEAWKDETSNHSNNSSASMTNGKDMITEQVVLLLDEGNRSISSSITGDIPTFGIDAENDNSNRNSNILGGDVYDSDVDDPDDDNLLANDGRVVVVPDSMIAHGLGRQQQSETLRQQQQPQGGEGRNNNAQTSTTAEESPLSVPEHPATGIRRTRSEDESLFSRNNPSGGGLRTIRDRAAVSLHNVMGNDREIEDDDRVGSRMSERLARRFPAPQHPDDLVKNGRHNSGGNGGGGGGAT